ncbi:uncharacterized protein LOC110443915 isoform X2 [Mizuhopecten yessoensis]|uniref:uncharacterized protein LOC110443915 isoform X2 n=1 Tax=Mizuhopecten yessoensis TaxID=6573 RepID=UPI000B4573D3|nr:uncharacterized protein LOC110443915 isoform X2 [Mizuhopecten yessoensis]
MPMDGKDVAKIEAHMEYIVGNFDVSDFITHLVGKGLTLETKQEIDQVKRIRDKNRKCLECLMKSKDGSYEVLIELLKERHYTNIIDKLESGLPPEDKAGKEAATPSIHVPEHKRHLRLTDKQLMNFSATVSPKDKIQWTTCLGIPELDVDHIDMDCHDSGTQMMKILLHWRVKSGKDATLGLLMDQFNQSLDIGVTIDTEKVEKLILKET